LDFAKLQALEERAMAMADWVAEFHCQLLGNQREPFKSKGSVSHQQA
jgi:hypothetical protein